MEDIREQEIKFKKLTDKILNQALDLGATEAQVSMTYGLGQSAEVRLGEVDTVEHYLDQDCSLAVFVGKKRGVASTSDLSDAGIKQALSAAIKIAEYTQEDPCSGLPDKKNLASLENRTRDLSLYYLADWDTEKLINRAQECEKIGMNLDSRIDNSDGASASYYLALNILGNTNGFLESVSSSRYSFDCTLIAEEDGKMQREGSYSSARDSNDLWSIEKVAKEASEQVIARLGARRIPTQTTPVIFRYDAARSLISHYLNAVSGGSLYRRQSFLLDSLGAKIFPDFFEISEDPFIPKALASTPFDSEGCEVFARNLVEAGRVKSYLLSTYAGRKLNLPSTGHAGGSHNIFVKSTGENLKALLKKMNKGLLVTDLIGQGVNLITGDYSRGASGFWVEDGEIKFPVEEITIASHLKTMFQEIHAVGNDADERSSLHCGSIWIPEMRVAGE